ncbi:MAG: glycogen/starch synthase [Prevotella sp.]|nr:glycogen/starch synthase [Prevotella sp.]MDY4666570.1 glycogen/starch synthase [Prevotella sp.]MDY5257951.1 glycogen/starch synthase [Prevotella sp.]MDY6270416.1 glycogen/starch synthase [Prevotella sp.]
MSTKQFPDYVFESSWEVCNKVGGIYTVLSTRARTMCEKLGDHVVFIGPDCWQSHESPYFKEDESLLASWHKQAEKDGLRFRAGRWLVPGNPIALLVDYNSLRPRIDEAKGKLWEWFGVDSLHAYGDYDDSLLFAWAAGRVAESFVKHNLKAQDNVIFQGHEWQSGAAVLYLRHECPQVATVFTTHATCIGRSIAGNGKPLYDYFEGYHGDQMAAELNMQSKHSMEKQAAHHCDCFTTVSDITARECTQLLDKTPDVVLPNGFDNDFVPRGAAYTRKRKAARQMFLRVANALTGSDMQDALIVTTSGRYEFRNKGIDLFIQAVSELRNDTSLTKPVLAFIEVPGWEQGPRKDLSDRLLSVMQQATPLPNPRLTHNLHNLNDDKVMGMMNALGIQNNPSDMVKLFFVPTYLTGDDGIFNMPYYDLMTGNDLCVYPSYYEPWGYTPLEAAAFSVPCVTTDLAGFGIWANSMKAGEGYSTLEEGVEVIHRTDSNFADCAHSIAKAISAYAALPARKATQCRHAAAKLASKALWSKFIKYYEQAYDVALCHAKDRK